MTTAPSPAPPPPAPSSPPRLVPLPPDRWPDSLSAVLDASRADGSGRANLFGTLAHHPSAATAWLGLARVLTHEGTLSARDHELLVLRTAHRLGSTFVWSRHRAHAVRPGGLSSAEAGATASPVTAHPWSARDIDVLEAADALVGHADLPDALWSRLSAHRTPEQLVELLVLAGQCAMVCTVLRTLRTPSDEASPEPAAAAATAAAVGVDGLPRVRLTRELCCSAGQCVLTAPEVFDQSDEDGLVTLRPDHRQRLDPSLVADARLAAALCPSGAISVLGADAFAEAGA